MTKRSRTVPVASDESEIRRSLLAYLQAHPQAADTLRGIINWWLPLQRYESSRQRIEQVLVRLVAEGLLRRDKLPDGEALYTLGKDGQPPRRDDQA